MNLNMLTKFQKLKKLTNNIERIYINKWGGRNPIFYGYDLSFLNKISRSFRIYNDPPKFKIFENVIYMPQYSCLYSSDGFRIDYGCLHRGYKGRHLDTAAPDKIELPEKLKRNYQRHIYVGEIRKHYGHFLTESIARLWYASKQEQAPVLYHLRNNNTREKVLLDMFFESIDLIDNCRLISFKEPTLFKEVIIPYPSFINLGEGFKTHNIIPENVAKNVLSTRQQRTSQPLYFSRRLLNPISDRLIINEDKLEEELRKNGFAICFPEKLSLEQQIHLVNKHEVIIGTIGSALHNILFDISPQRNIVCFADKDKISINYFIVDAIKSVNSVYLAALEIDPNCSKTKRYEKNRILDLDIAIDGLREVGLI